ncbi:MAG: hypothetical protein SGI92_25835, partial [Bryobacteraceae bacterium]|nr:hypothetical protein [Bryobacteraceae bacterium]
MKRVALICLACLGLTGCTDATVRRYAKLLGEQLRSYQTQLDRNLAAERRLYSELAAVFALEAERDVYGTLTAERLRTSRRESRRLESTTTLFDEHEFMRTQADREFEATREFYQKEMTLPEQTTGALRKLELNSQKVTELAAALQEFTEASKLSD